MAAAFLGVVIPAAPSDADSDASTDPASSDAEPVCARTRLSGSAKRPFTPPADEAASPPRRRLKRAAGEGLMPTPPRTPSPSVSPARPASALTPSALSALCPSPDRQEARKSLSRASSVDSNWSVDSGVAFAGHSIRTVFHRATLPETLLGRQEERARIVQFIRGHLEAHTAGGLYISGSPGTGKTVLVDDILRQLHLEGLSREATLVKINCMAVSTAAKAFAVLAEELLGASTPADQDAAARLQARFTDASAPMALVVLDEVDYLTMKDQDVLYRMFEWAARPGSRLILIGIANALDLTDRLLPRLRAANLEPQLLHFAPCSQAELVQLLRQRLALLPDPAPVVVDDAALELCARKVAANSGDIRKVLDVCRRAVERASAQATAAATGEAATAPVRVTIVHVAAVVTEVFGSPYVQKVRQLPLQGKLALCTLLLLQEARRGRDATLGDLQSVYLALCKHRGLVGAVSRSEFCDLCSNLEAGGLMTLSRAREERQRKLSLSIQPDDIRFALKDDDLVMRMLGDGLPPSVLKAAGVV